ncbi:MAG TPA: glucan biosynthesis protein [Candidatus Methylacidiphilales bacterium]
MRLHLVLACLTALLLYLTLRHEPGSVLRFAQVEELAAQRSRTPYVPLAPSLPPQLRALTPQQEQGIFWKDDYRLWRKQGLPFQVDFYHVSKAFPTGPRLAAVDRKGIHPLAYSPLFFNFLNLKIDPPLPTTLPYAGFYLRYPINKPGALDGFFSVLGSNYWRVLAKDQVYGLTARALAIDTAVDGAPEEFPEFTQWWLRQPASDAAEMTLEALLEGPSVTGAYEFRVRPGAVTSVDVRATLYFRKAVKRLGLAPFSSMYLYGENSGDHFGDAVHPEVHDSDGLLLDTADGEWIWRPLQAVPFLQLYDFEGTKLKGFGLLQRDRDFQHYQDLDAKYNVRPSAWVTPHGDWGKGTVSLVQLPTNNTNTDNVVLFWRPEKPPGAGTTLSFSYTVDFYMNDAARSPLAYAVATHCMAPIPGAPAAPGPAPVPVRFLVDFVGNGIDGIDPAKPPDVDLRAEPEGTALSGAKAEKNAYDGTWRVTFDMAPLKKNVPTELHCRLMRDGKPLSETWTYTWHQ